MAVGERAPSTDSRPAMKSSMVSRKPSGSNSAAAAASATSTTAALKGRLPVRQNTFTAVVSRLAHNLDEHARPSARARSGSARTERSRAPGPERRSASSQSDVTRAARKMRRQDNARNDAPAPHRPSPYSCCCKEANTIACGGNNRGKPPAFAANWRATGWSPELTAP